MTTDSVREGRRRAVSSLLAEEVLRDVATHLGREGVEVMPLKGVLYQRWLYEGEPSRALSDADILVREGLFGRGISILRAHGFEAIESTRSTEQISLRAPNGFDVDLHCRLFPQGRFRLRAEDVFARATHDAALFGVPLLLPEPVDAFAYAVGKFAADHADGRNNRGLDDLERLAKRFDLYPEDVAARLAECGMARAARFTLGILVRTRKNPFAKVVLEALPPDPVGVAVAGAAGLIVGKLPARSRWGAVASHGLYETLPRGIAAGARAALRRVRPKS